MSTNSNNSSHAGDFPPYPFYAPPWPYYMPIWQSPTHQGWICPKCGQVNAPWLAQCPGYHNQNITCEPKPNGPEFICETGK